MDIRKFAKFDVPGTVGSELLLTGARPVYRYDGNVRSDAVIGTAYTIICVQRLYTELTVKVLDKPQQVQAPEDGEAVKVQFSGLELFLYYRNGSLELGARAEGISVVNTKS